jgi:hypothetical protein
MAILRYVELRMLCEFVLCEGGCVREAARVRFYRNCGQDGLEVEDRLLAWVERLSGESVTLVEGFRGQSYLHDQGRPDERERCMFDQAEVRSAAERRSRRS